MLRRDQVLMVGDQALSGASNALPILLAARYLGIDEFGQISILVAGAIATLTWTRSTLGEVVLARGHEGRDSLRGVLGEGLLLGVVGAALTTAVYSRFGGPLQLTLLGLGLLPLIVIQDLLRQAAFAQRRVRVAFWGDGVWLVASLSLQCFWIVTGLESSSALMFYAWPAGAALGGVVMAASLGLFPRLTADGVRLKVTRRSLRIAAANLAGVAATYSATIIVAALLEPSAAGVMRLVSIFMTPANLLIATVPALLLPGVRDASTQGGENGLGKQTVALVAIVNVCSGAALSLLLPYFDISFGASIRWSIGAISAASGMLTFAVVTRYMHLRIIDDLRAYAHIRTVWSAAFPFLTAIGAATLGVVGVFLGSMLASCLEWWLLSKRRLNEHYKT